MRNNEIPHPGAYDEDVARLSQDLRQQVERAKERIADRYGKLMDAPASGRARNHRTGS